MKNKGEQLISLIRRLLLFFDENDVKEAYNGVIFENIFLYMQRYPFLTEKI